MLKRIITIQNVGRFTGLTGEPGNQGEFAKLNVIYAKNAEGKSTLCDIFRSLTKDDPSYVVGRRRFGSTSASKVELLLNGSLTSKANYNAGGWTTTPGSPVPNIHIYDERFVLENVLIGHQMEAGQRRNLFGLVIGARAIALEKRVGDASEAQTRATGNRSAAEANVKNLLPQNVTLDAWRKLPALDLIDEQITNKDGELQRARTAAQNTTAIATRPVLSTLALPGVPTDLDEVLSATLDGFAAGAMEKVRTHLEKHNGLDLAWVKRGFDATVDSDCPYCGQSFDGIDLIKMYASIFNDALKAHQDRLDELEQSVKQGFGDLNQLTLKQLFEKHEAERLWWKESGGLAFELARPVDVETMTSRMANLEKDLLSALQRKRLDPSRAAVLSEDEKASIEAWSNYLTAIQPYVELVAKANEAIKSHRAQPVTADVKRLDADLNHLKATKARHATVAVEAFQKLGEAEAQKTQADGEKTKANDALRIESTRVFKEYGASINRYLEQFNVDFKIASATVSFPGGKPSGEVVLEMQGQEIKTTAAEASDPSKPSLLNTLSSGDKSALALAYFLSVLEGEPDKTNSVVVLDDPFHRQDRSRRTRTVERIHEVASTFGQTFVLSHDLQFARAIQRAPIPDVRTFRFVHNGSISSLQSTDFPPIPDPEFVKDYKTLQAFAENPSSEDEACRSVVRSIRQLLEGYLRVKYPGLGNMIDKIKSAPENSTLSFGQGMISDLTQVNDYSKVHYHSLMETDAIDSVELTGYVKQTLGIVHR
jgi:wobble nucleotide-excising tRNase